MTSWFKKILVFPVVITVIIFSISANKSNWSGMDLTADEINHSIHFQLARGGNCIGEFQKLAPVLDRFKQKKIDATYLSNILGEPNNKIIRKSGIEYNYYLTTEEGRCRVNFVIENANLVSYNFGNCK